MNQIKIYYLQHEEEIDESIFQRMMLLLPESFQSEIKTYKHRQSAQASLLGKILLLYGLKELKITVSLDDLQVGKKERPFLNDKIDFNISHSGKYIVVAISEGGRVGIDIEKHRPMEISLFKKYFDDNEWKEIESSENPNKVFFNLWTIKESAIKCDGRGVEVLSKTHVHYPIIQKLETINKITCDRNEFYFQQLNMDENYSCAVCSDHHSSIIISPIALESIESHL